MSVEDRKTLKIVESKISKADGHYQMSLLWRQDPPQLPFNRPAAEARLRGPIGRFLRETKYRAVIDDYICKGHARRLTKEGPRLGHPVVHCTCPTILPHF